MNVFDKYTTNFTVLFIKLVEYEFYQAFFLFFNNTLRFAAILLYLNIDKAFDNINILHKYMYFDVFHSIIYEILVFIALNRILIFVDTFRLKV